MIFVVLCIVLTIGSVWGITAQGSTNYVTTDTFGNPRDAGTINHTSNISGALAISTMPLMYVVFFLAVCVVLVMVFAWLWNIGHTHESKY